MRREAAVCPVIHEVIGGCVRPAERPIGEIEALETAVMHQILPHLQRDLPELRPIIVKIGKPKIGRVNARWHGVRQGVE